MGQDRDPTGRAACWRCWCPSAGCSARPARSSCCGMVGSGGVLFAVALLFMRNQIRPIRRLAAAAERFGKGRDTPGFKPEGALEVRQAARAFLVMRERIQRQISQRTEMLAGVSHDLRTPLTRMKLAIGAARRHAGHRGVARGCRGDGADDRRLPCLRPRRGVGSAGGDRSERSAGGRESGRPPRRGRWSSSTPSPT